jgi:hypothetical protein
MRKFNPLCIKISLLQGVGRFLGVIEDISPRHEVFGMPA